MLLGGSGNDYSIDAAVIINEGEYYVNVWTTTTIWMHMSVLLPTSITYHAEMVGIFAESRMSPTHLGGDMESCKCRIVRYAMIWMANYSICEQTAMLCMPLMYVAHVYGCDSKHLDGRHASSWSHRPIA